MSIGLFDKIATNHQLLLSLPFREGVGTITHDRAKPQHLLTQHDPGGGSFVWGNLANGCPYLEFIRVGGAGPGVYLDCPAADTGDLDFTTEDYSVTCWINHHATGHFNPKILIGRYGVDLDGWEIYLESDTGIGVDYLEHRHHHSSLGAGNLRDGCYSKGWTPNSGWSFLGISRSGLYPRHYRNGIPLEMSYNATGMRDPDTCNRDLVIGARFTKDQDWLDGMIWDLRVWLGELTPIQMMTLFHMDRALFGVN